MSVLDRIRKKGRQDKNVITVEAEIVDNYMKEAEKAAQIVEANINNGDFSHINCEIDNNCLHSYYGSLFMPWFIGSGYSAVIRSI